MYKDIDILGKEIEFECLGCDIANHKLIPPGDFVYDDGFINVSADPVIPIKGFMVLGIKKHIKSMNELSSDERNRVLKVLNKTVEIIKKVKISEEVLVLQEERSKHFHIWIVPIHAWMERFKKSVFNIKEIVQYAKDNFGEKEKQELLLAIENIKKEFENSTNIFEENMVVDVILNRRSHRKYLSKEIDDNILKIILDCGRNASFGGKPNKKCQVSEFIIIKNNEIKENLALKYEDRQFIKDAPVIIAVCANKDNDPKYKEYVLSSSLSIQNIILSAESFGIGACILSCFLYNENHKEDKEFTRKLLNLPENIELIALISLGYKDNEEKIPEKELKTLEEIIHVDRY